MRKYWEKIKKLIKKLTFFDWMAIAIFLVVILAVLLLLGKKEKWVQIEVRVIPHPGWEESFPSYWAVGAVKKEDAEYDSLGRRIAKVLTVKNFEGTGKERVIYLQILVRAGYDNRTKKITYNYDPLEIGGAIDLHLGMTRISGLVTYIEGVTDERFWEDKVVETRLIRERDIFPGTQGIDVWLADAIKVGDQMKDSQGTIIAEVVSRRIEPAQAIFTTDSGRVLINEDPTKKDVYLNLRLRTLKQDGVNYYFNDYKVKVGSLIPLFLPQVDLWPVITKIVD